MNSIRNSVIGGFALVLLLVASLVAIRPAVAASGAGFELLVIGNPYSPVPAPFNVDYSNIGLAWDSGSTSISDIGGLSANGNSVSITATCTSGADPDNNVAMPLVQLELGSQLAYQYQVAGAAANLCAASEIDSFQLTFTTNAASCLVSGQPDQLEAGTYPLTRSQVNNDDFNGTDFTFDPLATAYPAFIATKGGVAGTFTSTDVLGGETDKWGLAAYLPASRPCAPTAGPAFTGTTPFTTNLGRLGVYTGLIAAPTGSAISQIQAQAFTTTIALASGGGGRYNDPQIMSPSPGSGITGAKRIQALPLNAGSSGATPWGGIRTDGLFVQCGANNITTLVTIITQRCRMAGTTPAVIGGTGNAAPGLGVRVQQGGAVSATDGFRHWSAAGTAEVGQTVKFRTREVSWVGYGLHSPETTGTMTNGN